MTPHFIPVVFLDASAAITWSLAAVRIANNRAPALLDVVVSVLARPERERTRLAAAACIAIDAVSSYLQAMQRDLSLGICVSPELLTSARRDACRAIDELDSLASAMRHETPSCEQCVAAANVIVRHLRRLVDTVSPLEHLAAGTSHPDRCRLAAINVKCIALLRGAQVARDESGDGAIPPADHAPPAFFVQVIAQKATESAAAVGAVRATIS